MKGKKKMSRMWLYSIWQASHWDIGVVKNVVLRWQELLMTLSFNAKIEIDAKEKQKQFMNQFLRIINSIPKTQLKQRYSIKTKSQYLLNQVSYHICVQI